MTQKDYIKFADAIGKLSDSGIMARATKICIEVFKADNPNFSERRFRDHIKMKQDMRQEERYNRALARVSET